MVRQVKAALASRTPALLGAAALAILLWHVLACTESPMAFSPDGKDLAFTAMEPYGGDGKELALAGPVDYRLMVLKGRRDLRVVEQTTDAMLTAPAYSPDGSQMCYVRIPLLSTAQLQQLQQESKSRSEAWKKAIETPPQPLPDTVGSGERQAATAASQPSWAHKDLTLPSLEGMMNLLGRVGSNRPLRAELVIRNTADDAILKALPLELYGLDWQPQGDDGLHSLLMLYLTLRPQYSPDGQWIYLCAGDVLMAIDPEHMVRRMLAVQATSATLSPDGKTVAFIHEPGVGLARTDGSATTYVRLEGEPSMSGLAWADDKTLAVLMTPGKHDTAASGPAAGETRKLAVHFVNFEGQTVSRLTLDTPVKSDGMNVGELAISPDGKRLVVSMRETVHFLDRSGKLLRTVDAKSTDANQSQDANPLLVQPTFAPDGRSVALRSMSTGKDGAGRTDGIVFFSPDGKELSRVAVPPIPAGTTRPAEPATAPAEPATAQAD